MAGGKHYWLSEKEMQKLDKKQIEDIKNTLDKCITEPIDINMAMQPDKAGYNAVALTVMVGIAQYKKEWINYLVEHKLQLIFSDPEGNDIPVAQWVWSKEFQAWFINLRDTFPGILFFIGPKEARFLLAAAEIIGSIPANEVNWHTGTTTATFHFSDGEMDELEEVLMYQCQSFIHYCFDTGVNPEPHVTEMLKEFGFAAPYKEMEAICLKHKEERKYSITF